MSVTIKRKQIGGRQGFSIRFAEPKTGLRTIRCDSPDLLGVNLALNHYFGAGNHAAKPVRACPLCQQTARGKCGGKRKEADEDA